MPTFLCLWKPLFGFYAGFVTRSLAMGLLTPAPCDSYLGQCPSVSLGEDRSALITHLQWEGEAVPRHWMWLTGWRAMAGAGLNRKSKHDCRTEGHEIMVGASLQIHRHFPSFPESFFKISNSQFYQEKNEIVVFINSKTSETSPCQARLHCSYK